MHAREREQKRERELRRISIYTNATHLNSLPKGSFSGDIVPPLPAPSLREDARALDMYAIGAGGGLQGG